MANRFCQHGLSTGSNNGTSWENAYQSIFTAISSAVTGDSVYVKEHSGIDISSGGISFGKRLNLYGGCDASLTGTATGPRGGTTVLDGNLANVRGITMTTGCVSSSVHQFRVQHTRYTGDAGAIYVDANWASPYWVSLVNCSALDCYGVNGGAIRSYRVTLYMAGLHVEDCVASGNGGAIYANDGGIALGWAGPGGAVITSWLINNSTSGNGGAVCAGPSDDDLFVSGWSIYIGNTANGTGGAIWARTKNNGSRVSDCLIYNNSAAQIGGVYWNAVADNARVIFSTIVGNGATVGDVGGVQVAGLMSMDSCIVRNNIGVASNIQCNAFAAGTISNSDIQDKDTTGVVPVASLGSGCLDVDPEFMGSGDHPYDLSSDTPESVANGGNSGVTHYGGLDVLVRQRYGASPSMGAYELTRGLAALFAMQGSI